MEANQWNYDYKWVVYEKANPSNRKETFYFEKIEGQTYGYDALVDTCERMNREYPQWSHEVYEKIKRYAIKDMEKLREHIKKSGTSIKIIGAELLD